MDMVTSSKSAFFHYTPQASHSQVNFALLPVVFSNILTFLICVKQSVLSSQNLRKIQQKIQ